MSLPPPEHEDHVDARFKRHNCYTAEQMQAYGQECYEKALLDAMNATLPFGKTGAVIAAAIRSLK